MEKWLIEALEYKDQMEQMDINSKKRLSVKCYDDLNVPNPTEIVTLIFEEKNICIDLHICNLVLKFINLKEIIIYSGFKYRFEPYYVNIWLSTLPYIEKLKFFSDEDHLIEWADLKQLDLTRLKFLYIGMHNISEPFTLKAPMLEQLSIYGSVSEELTLIQKRCLKRIKFDFSGMPSLKKVELMQCGHWDYSSLSSLHQLEHLHIKDINLEDLSWLSSDYSLSKLIIYGCLESLTGINTQPNLIHLDLSYNNISDITALEQFKHLKYIDLRGNMIKNITSLENLNCLEYLNLKRNPLVSQGNLRNKNINTLIINSSDEAISRIQHIISEFSHYAYTSIKRENKLSLSQSFEKITDIIALRNQRLACTEQLKLKIQDAFEREFKSINPFDLKVDDIELDFKKRYVEEAISKYPFLKVTEYMKKEMQKEKSHMLTKLPEISGLVGFSDDDFTIILAKAHRGTGKITYKTPVLVSSGRRLWYVPSETATNKINSAIKKNWSIFFPQMKMNEFDFTIIYDSLYGKEMNVKITYAILYAMWSAVHNIVLPQKTAMLIKCSNSGGLNKEEAKLRQINVSLGQGVEKIISWVPKSRTARYSLDGMVGYNTLEDFATDLRAEEELHYKRKYLDSFRMELVDVIENHILSTEEHQRIQCILRDLFPDKKKEINLLVLLLQMNILEEIKNQNYIDSLFISKFVSAMENGYGISRENAEYAVRTWCLCYGKYNLGINCDI